MQEITLLTERKIIYKMNYKTRTNCVFCGSKLSDHLFENDYDNYVAHYAVDNHSDSTTHHSIPYNVLKCGQCGTSQMKYLGDIEEIYKINHADGTGSTMHNMHQSKLDLILKYKDDIEGILEIGSSKGILSDLIIDNLKTDYCIIEPSYFGNYENKTVINDFYENVDDTSIECNTLVMSHVFEHFYNPLEIIQKIEKNKNIENIFLTFPNLEEYIEKNIFHVLNTEHTFYVDNNIIEQLFLKYGFELKEKKLLGVHSVHFYFKRTTANKEIKLHNKKHDVKHYYYSVFEIVTRYNNIIDTNPDKDIYLFPASCHSIFLTIFGLKYEKLKGMIDNSPNKIGKKMYGIDLPIYSFNETMKNKNAIFLMNGGMFNNEVEKKLIDNSIEYYI